MNTPELIKLYGNITTFTVPSGFVVAIREQNGEDDGILSNLALSKDSASINSFIEGIVVGVDWKEGLLDNKDVLSMRLGDKYCILINSRIFSVGSTLKFKWEWISGQPPVPYVEDLKKFIWDYAMPLPKVGHPDYFEGRIQAYPKGVSNPTITLPNGRSLRYKYLDGYGEQYLLKLPDFNANINSKLVARDLEEKVDDKWVPIETFKSFSSKEMSIIRDSIDKDDPQFDGQVDITNPVTGETKYLPLISLHDFFFQREI